MLMLFPVIIQCPGLFLCSFLPSSLSSLTMMMSSLGCLLLSSMPFVSASSFACRCSLVSAFKRAFRRLLAAFSGLCDVLFGTYFQDYTYRFYQYFVFTILKPSSLNNLVLDVRHNEVDMSRDRERTP